ncbi:MAG: hypothetical protein RIM72_17665 [Alphaproteobacteria bacterium]
MQEHIRERVKTRRRETVRPIRVGPRRAPGSLRVLRIPHPDGCGKDAQQIESEIKVTRDRGDAAGRGLISPDAHGIALRRAPAMHPGAASTTLLPIKRETL